MEPLEDNVQALIQAFLMIILSEIGDKTFLIAAILAMRHPRLLVFAGAFSSLLVMSVLSATLGHALPALIPKRWTQFAASVLFLVFGSRMWAEGRAMHAGSSKVLEEMREVEDVVETDEATVSGGIPLDRMETGRASAAPKSRRSKLTEGARNLSNFLLGPVFVQAFVLTFLGEWGDRSQIATIALGAAHNVYTVSFGTVLGHSLCTALAVLGGRYVSTRISVRAVTLSASILFLLFGLGYLFEAVTDKDIESRITSLFISDHPMNA